MLLLAPWLSAEERREALADLEELGRVRSSRLRKPVLLMALFSEADGADLVAQDIDLILATDDSGERVAKAARQAGRQPRVHIYMDTGMSRMGIPYHRALPWLEDVAPLGLDVRSTFMGFTEKPDFDPEQLRRFKEVTATAKARGFELGALHAASSNGVYHLPEAHLDMVRPGIALYGAYPSDAESEHAKAEVTATAKARGFELGALHAASSNGVYHLPEAHLDMVRPGIALYGAYPSDAESEHAKAELHPAVSLRARIVRVERLRAGDTVSYGGNYTAERPTWIATVPVGHTDGYPRQAVNGAKILVNGTLYPAIGAVSASHTIIEVGEEPDVSIGDVATLLGPDDPAIRPNALAEVSGSVYDVLMHLNPGLPKVLV